jgi:hypothetical protein
MAACSHKGGGCSCSAPTSVAVKGYSRGAGPRKRKRAPAKATRPYWIASDDAGHTCGHRHRSLAGASRCAKRHRAGERARRARLTRKQARADRVRHWSVERVTP